MHLYLLHCILHHYYKSFQLRKDHDKPLLFVFLYFSLCNLSWTVLDAFSFKVPSRQPVPSRQCSCYCHYQLSHCIPIIDGVMYSKKIYYVGYLLKLQYQQNLQQNTIQYLSLSASYFNLYFSSLCKHMKIIKNQNLLRHFV